MSVVSGPVVRRDHLKELLESLEERSNSGGQAKIGPTDKSEVKSPGRMMQLFLRRSHQRRMFWLILR